MLIKARVDIKKPDIKDLLKKDFTLVDMHFHSRYSDGINKIPNILKRARKLGIGIAITDHNEIKGSMESAKHKDILTIPGTELTTFEGIHLLAYFYKSSDLSHFYNKHIVCRKKSNLFCLDIGISDILDRLEDYNAITCAAHPFAIFWTGLCKVYHEPKITEETHKRIDAIEVINGSNMKSRNRMALDFAEKNKKSITAGTDGHTLHEMGNVLTYTKFPATSSQFLDSIKDETNFIVGKETFIIRKAAAHSVKFKPTRTTALKSYAVKTADYMNIKRKNFLNKKRL